MFSVISMFLVVVVSAIVAISVSVKLVNRGWIVRPGSFVLLAITLLVVFSIAGTLAVSMHLSPGLPTSYTVITNSDTHDRDTENARVAGTKTSDAWCDYAIKTVKMSVDAWMRATVYGHECVHAWDRELRWDGTAYYWSQNTDVYDAMDSKGGRVLISDTKGYAGLDTAEFIACAYERWRTMTTKGFTARYGKKLADVMTQFTKQVNEAKEKGK